MTEKLRIGIIGAGFISHFQLAAMAQVRNVELAGVYSPNTAVKLSDAARERDLGPAIVYDSIQELTKNVDTVAIYCPNYTRVEVMEQVVDAVKSGAELKGVICEKPLGRNVKEARRMVELAEEVNLRTSYFENQLHMKPVKAQLRQLEPQQRTMGPLMLTRCSEEHSGPHEPWFWDPVRQGGGVLCDMACHSIAVGWYCLTPLGKPLTYMKPYTVSAEVGLLKWGQPYWREKLKSRMGVDYKKTPAEDFATGIISYKNPDTGQVVKSQFTNSWMFEKQGLRIFMDGMGPGYAFEFNTLVSPLTVFIGDEAAQAAADAEKALEKSTASRGLLTVHHNEADIYGYVDENEDTATAFLQGRNGMMDFRYGLEVTRLVMASYMAAERQQTLDLTDENIQNELETYIPAIQQGKGADVMPIMD
ncbi:MAG: Gfo/Idh/MocA family protein [bacterium]|jgi:predicted dehydrogenase